MPTYSYACGCGAMFDRILRVKDYDQPQTCECGVVARKLLTVPMVFVSPTIAYESPIDGRQIIGMQARKEDLARSGCVEYDPEMKKDYTRRLAREDAAMDAKIDSFVEAQIDSMPSHKQEKLHNELLSGVEAVAERL